MRISSMDQNLASLFSALKKNFLDANAGTGDVVTYPLLLLLFLVSGFVLGMNFPLINLLSGYWFLNLFGRLYNDHSAEEELGEFTIVSNFFLGSLAGCIFFVVYL